MLSCKRFETGHWRTSLTAINRHRLVAAHGRDRHPCIDLQRLVTRTGGGQLLEATLFRLPVPAARGGLVGPPRSPGHGATKLLG